MHNYIWWRKKRDSFFSSLDTFAMVRFLTKYLTDEKTAGSKYGGVDKNFKRKRIVIKFKNIKTIDHLLK